LLSKDPQPLSVTIHIFTPLIIAQLIIAEKKPSAAGIVAFVRIIPLAAIPSLISHAIAGS
jgi:hypothetical protein